MGFLKVDLHIEYNNKPGECSQNKYRSYVMLLEWYQTKVSSQENAENSIPEGFKGKM